MAINLPNHGCPGTLIRKNGYVDIAHNREHDWKPQPIDDVFSAQPGGSWHRSF